MAGLFKDRTEDKETRKIDFTSQEEDPGISPARVRANLSIDSIDPDSGYIGQMEWMEGTTHQITGGDFGIEGDVGLKAEDGIIIWFSAKFNQWGNYSINFTLEPAREFPSF